MNKITDIILATQLATVFAGGFLLLVHYIDIWMASEALGPNWIYFQWFFVMCACGMMAMPHILGHNQRNKELLKEQLLTPSEKELLNYAECSDL